MYIFLPLPSDLFPLSMNSIECQQIVGKKTNKLFRCTKKLQLKSHAKIVDYQSTILFSSYHLIIAIFLLVQFLLLFLFFFCNFFPLLLNMLPWLVFDIFTGLMLLKDFFENNVFFFFFVHWTQQAIENFQWQKDTIKEMKMIIEDLSWDPVSMATGWHKLIHCTKTNQIVQQNRQWSLGA